MSYNNNVTSPPPHHDDIPLSLPLCLQAALFFCGLAMIFITLLVTIQGSRKSDKIFNTLLVAHSPLHLTLADRRAPPEPIEASDSDSDSIPHDGTVRSRAPGGATNIQ